MPPDHYTRDAIYLAGKSTIMRGWRGYGYLGNWNGGGVNHF